MCRYFYAFSSLLTVIHKLCVLLFAIENNRNSSDLRAAYLYVHSLSFCSKFVFFCRSLNFYVIRLFVFTWISLTEIGLDPWYFDVNYFFFIIALKHSY